MVSRLSTLAIIAALSCACTVIEGDGQGYKYASLGGNAQGLNMTPNSASVASVDNATGAAIAKDAISDMASAYALGKAFDALGNLIDEGFDALKDSNATDEAINANNNAAKVNVETFVPPEPEVPVP